MSGETVAHKIGVFWNMDDCQIPDGEDIHEIQENIKSALEKERYQGEISIKAYSDKKESAVEFSSQASFKKYLRDVLFFALQNPVQHTPHTLVLICKIPNDGEIAYILRGLISRGYIVVAAVPDDLTFVASVWLWPSLASGLEGGAEANARGKEATIGSSPLEGAQAKTGVFCNIKDFTVAPHVASKNIQSYLANLGHLGGVQIWGYIEKYYNVDDWVWYYSQGGITLQNTVLNYENQDGSPEVDQMLVDIVLWALDNPPPSNLLVMAKDFSEETKKLVGNLKLKGYTILDAPRDEARLEANPVYKHGSLINPNQAMDPSTSVRRQGPCNTSLFWNIEDCPVPHGFDPRTFLQLIEKAVKNHGYDGKVSISAYVEKNESLNDLSLTNTNISLVPTGDRRARSTKMLNDILFWALENKKESIAMVITTTIPHNFFTVLQALKEKGTIVLLAQPRTGYVSSVWLWESLASGKEATIDLRGSS